MFRIPPNHLIRSCPLLRLSLLRILPTPRPRFLRVTARHHDLSPQGPCPSGSSPPEEPLLTQDHSSLLARIVKLEQNTASTDARLLMLEATVRGLQNSEDLDEEEADEEEECEAEEEESDVLAESKERMADLLKCDMPERVRAELLYMQDKGLPEPFTAEELKQYSGKITVRFLITVLRAQKNVLDAMSVNSPDRAVVQEKYSHLEYRLNYILGQPF